jgi:hypothetical protein
VQLTRSGTGSGSYDVHPEETHLVVTVDSDPVAVDPKNELLLVDLAEEAITNLSADNPASDVRRCSARTARPWPGPVRPSTASMLTTARLILRDLDSVDERNVTANWDRSMSGMIWAPGQAGLYASIADAGTVRVYFVDASGRQPRAITGRDELRRPEHRR